MARQKSTEHRLDRLERKAVKISKRVDILYERVYQHHYQGRRPGLEAQRQRSQSSRKHWAELLNKYPGAFKTLGRMVVLFSKPGTKKMEILFLNRREKQLLKKMLKRQRPFSHR